MSANSIWSGQTVYKKCKIYISAKADPRPSILDPAGQIYNISISNGYAVKNFVQYKFFLLREAAS